jgi:hypothetical protein
MKIFMKMDDLRLREVFQNAEQAIEAVFGILATVGRRDCSLGCPFMAMFLSWIE